MLIISIKGDHVCEALAQNKYSVNGNGSHFYFITFIIILVINFTVLFRPRASLSKHVTLAPQTH